MNKEHIIEEPSIKLVKSRAIYFWILLFAIIVRGQEEKGNISSSTHRNVVFIIADDLSNTLGFYDVEGVHTPNLDKLSKKGIVMDRAYAQASLCNPSRSSILTGKRPNQLKIWSNAPHFRGIHPRISTLPEVFKKSGYTTVGIGKIFHNWSQALKGDPQSWSRPERFNWAPHSQDWYISGRPYEVHKDIPKGAAVQMEDVPDEAYLDGRIANEAVNMLKDLQETPFFMAVGFWKPHLPYNAPKKYWDLYKRDALPKALYPKPVENISEWNYVDSNEARSYTDVPKKRAISENKKKELRHGYLASISYLDAQVGKILDELDRLNLTETTTIVFLSDHGYHAGEHGQFGKWTNFEIGTRVPLLISSPGITKPGTRSSSLVELVDLFPTLLDVCELDASLVHQKLDGSSILPILKDPSKRIKSVAISQIPRPLGAGASFTIIGSTVRNEGYRYVQWKKVSEGSIVSEELYDLRTDIYNAENLWESTGNRKIKEDLKKALSQTLNK